MVTTLLLPLLLPLLLLVLLLPVPVALHPLAMPALQGWPTLLICTAAVLT
jgi:hypothetical protein